MRPLTFRHCRNGQKAPGTEAVVQWTDRHRSRAGQRLFLLGLPLLFPTLPLLGADDAATGADLQAYHPSTTHGLLGLEAPVTLSPGGGMLGLSVNYANDLLSLKFSSTQDPVKLVAYQSIAHLHGGYGLNDWLEVGGSLPMVINNVGLDPASGEAFEARSMGDLGLYLRAALLPEGKSVPGVTIQLPVTFPTGDETHYLGDPGLTFSPQLSVGQLSSRFGWTAMVGYRIRGATTLEYKPYSVSLPIGNEMLYGLAGDVEVQRGLRIAAGLEGRIGASAQVGDSPLEGRVGLRLGMSSGMILNFGGAFGISAGYGVPVFRMFGGVSYAYKTRGFWHPDADADGFTDDADKCPNEAEDLDGWLDGDGCPDPDNDSDGVLDAADRCPVEPESVNGVTDEDGCPEPDRDVDGLVDDADRCPDRPEDHDNFEDLDGCPEEDNDGDGIPDAHDTCPLASEDRDSFQDEDGCPDPDNDGDLIQDLVDRCPNEAEIRNGTEDEDGCPDAVEMSEIERLAAEAAAKKAAAAEPPPMAEGDAEDESSDLPDASSDPLQSMTVDTDHDGIVNGLDACPRKPETVNGFKDKDGCPEKDSDEDGIPDALDKCPKKAESINGIQDKDGCPEKDSDGDGIVDPVDACPKKPETMNAYRDGDGCPDIVDESGPEEVHPASHGAKASVPASASDNSDEDGDGIRGAADLCPRKPEIFNGVEDEDGCPEADSDGDGIIDALDKCPKKPEWVNGFKDDDGCPEWDTDKDGIFDALDKCPKVPETVNGIEDSDGCPELDSDQDGVLDLNDQCPETRETANGYKDSDGCPDTAPPPGKKESTRSEGRSGEGSSAGAREKSEPRSEPRPEPKPEAPRGEAPGEHAGHGAASEEKAEKPEPAHGTEAEGAHP